MASVTLSIYDIMTNAAPNKPLSDIENIYEVGSQYVFGNARNVISDQYREVLITGFCLHYLFDEIGMETLPAWQMALTEKLYNNRAFIELILENLDKQLYDTYEMTIVDRTGGVTRKDKIETKRNEKWDGTNKAETVGEAKQDNKTTRDITDISEDKITQKSGGSDTATQKQEAKNEAGGTDTTKSIGTDTTKHTGTDGQKTAQYGITKQTHTDEIEYTTETSRDGSVENVQSFDNYSQTNEREFLGYKETVKDRTRTRTIQQYSDTPQGGLTGSDIIGNGNESILNGTGSGGKYLTNATITDSQVDGENSPTTRETQGGIRDTSATQGTIENTQSYDGFIETSHRTPGNNSRDITEVELLGDNGHPYGTDTEATYNSTVTRTPSLTNTVEYGRIDTSNATTNTTQEYGREDERQGKQTVKGTGTITDDGKEQTKVNTEETTGSKGDISGTSELDRKDERKVHGEEKHFKLSYETVSKVQSMMEKIWNLFDPIMLQVY